MTSERIMRVAIWDFYNKTTPISDFLLGEQMGLLSKASKIPVEVVYDVDMGGNIEYPNGSWGGIIGMAQRGEADLLVGNFFVSDERMKVVDFLYPHREESITFATRMPEPESNAFAVFSPFTVSVWATLAAFVVLVAVSLYFMAKRKIGFFRLLSNVFAGVTSQGMTVGARQFKSRHLLLAWAVGMTFFVNCYTSVLLSFLTFPTLTGIKDINQLAQAVGSGKYQCALPHGSSIGYQLAKSEREADKIIGEHLLKGEGLIGSVHLLLGNPDKNIAVITLRGDLEPLDIAFFVSEDSFQQFMMGNAVRKGFCCTKELNRASLRILETGLIEKLYRRKRFPDAYRIISRMTSESPVKALKLQEVLGIFLVLLGGQGIALVVLLLETILKKIEHFHSGY